GCFSGSEPSSPSSSPQSSSFICRRRSPIPIPLSTQAQIPLRRNPLLLRALPFYRQNPHFHQTQHFPPQSQLPRLSLQRFPVRRYSLSLSLSPFSITCFFHLFSHFNIATL
ncbi:hypothetical protein ACSQ67_009492, partial [Phaseolus vulgaris]